MKHVFTHEGSPPFPNWRTIRTRYPVHLPNLEGDGFAQTIEVVIDAWENEDGEIFIPGPIKEKLEEVKARYMGLLSPEEIKDLRESLGLSQADICQLLQLGAKTWTRWETGRERPSRSMNLLLHAICDGKVDVNYLRAMRDPALRQKVIHPRRPITTDRSTYSHPAESQARDEILVSNA